MPEEFLSSPLHRIIHSIWGIDRENCHGVGIGMYRNFIDPCRVSQQVSDVSGKGKFKKSPKQSC